MSDHWLSASGSMCIMYIMYGIFMQYGFIWRHMDTIYMLIASAACPAMKSEVVCNMWLLEYLHGCSIMWLLQFLEEHYIIVLNISV